MKVNSERTRRVKNLLNISNISECFSVVFPHNRMFVHTNVKCVYSIYIFFFHKADEQYEMMMKNEIVSFF